MSLKRLIVEFKPDGIHTRVLYRTASGSGPSTKKRQREAAQLAREALEQALEALKEGPV